MEYGMGLGGSFPAMLDVVVREAGLFAAAGFLLLGIGDLAVDAIWLGMAAAAAGRPRPALDALPPPRAPGRLAVFVPAWDEAAVIGPMLRRALRVWDGHDFAVYV